MKVQLSDHFTYKKLLRFVLPSVVMMVFTSIYGVVDGLFVSNFAGKTAFAEKRGKSRVFPQKKFGGSRKEYAFPAGEKGAFPAFARAEIVRKQIAVFCERQRF